MSRRAAEAGFEEFLDETLEAIDEEFSVARTLGGGQVDSGGVAVDRLLEHSEKLQRHVVEPELASYRERLLAQFQVLLDYVESDDPLAAYEDALLEHDIFVDALDPAASERERERVIDDVLASLERLADGIAPIVERPEDDFWAAAEAAYDRANAVDLVEEAFPFTGPLRTREELFAFEVTIDPSEILGTLALALPSFTVDYTDEAARAMTEGERRVIEDTKRKIEARFDDAE